jgi:5-methylcytosine-specific restriction endonuclease McrA
MSLCEAHKEHRPANLTGKECSKCGLVKPLRAFSLMPSSPDGRYPSCKVCKAAMERHRRRSNPEAIRALQAATRERNRERIRRQDRERRAANVERYRERDRRRWPQRREVRRPYNRLAMRRRRVGHDMHAEEYAERVLRFDPCAYCGKRTPNSHADHIEPIALGGRNGWENLTAACAVCNHRKSAVPLLIFLLRRLEGVS